MATLFSGVSSPGHAKDREYVVKKSDTLMQIAKRHGVGLHDLARYNKLKNLDALAIGQHLKIPPRPGEPRDYRVKKGDTVGGIAKKFGTSSSAIIAYNNLRNPDRLSINQLLKIPVGKAPAQNNRLPSSALRQLDKTRVHSSKWKYIVIHHSASVRGTMAGMDEYHRKKRRMENGLAYHFVIGNGYGMGDGEIGIGNRWKRQIRGGHLASEYQNERSIGICLVGNFEKKPPTRKQIASTRALLNHLMKRCRLGTGAIKTHKQINVKPTICPGRHFHLNELISGL
ncbi:MAG: LysM peptidoglycan-binding domain-containing protein [Verrucomicrobiota bacterium]